MSSSVVSGHSLQLEVKQRGKELLFCFRLLKCHTDTTHDCIGFHLSTRDLLRSSGACVFLERVSVLRLYESLIVCKI